MAENFFAMIDRVKRNIRKNAKNPQAMIDALELALVRGREDFNQDPVGMTLGSANLGGVGSGLAGLAGITAYHGSPHLFNKFSLDKIGSGEGAQVYGHGLYFADNPAVAEQYSKMAFRGRNPDTEAEAQLISNWASVEKMENSKAKGKTPFGDPWSEVWERRLQNTIADAEKKGARPSSLYKVDIPDEAVEKMLLWDKPLSEQPEAVRKALQGIGADFPKIPDFDLDKWTSTSPLASTWYNALARDMGVSQSDVSEILRRRGVPGIRYFDAGSREVGKGTMNTVLFDDNLVSILERNGVPMQGLQGLQGLGR